MAFTLTEVMVATAVMVIIFLALFSGIAYGLTEVQLSRENLRATQILLERMEGIRLYTFDQLVSSNMFPASFTAAYYPLAVTNQSSQGIVYYGQFAISDSQTGTDYNSNLRAVTVSVSWTNTHWSKQIPHSRQMQTLVGRYGIQNYTFFE